MYSKLTIKERAIYFLSRIFIDVCVCVCVCLLRKLGSKKWERIECVCLLNIGKQKGKPENMGIVWENIEEKHLKPDYTHTSNIKSHRVTYCHIYLRPSLSMLFIYLSLLQLLSISVDVPRQTLNINKIYIYIKTLSMMRITKGSESKGNVCEG